MGDRTVGNGWTLQDSRGSTTGQATAGRKTKLLRLPVLSQLRTGTDGEIAAGTPKKTTKFHPQRSVAEKAPSPAAQAMPPFLPPTPGACRKATKDGVSQNPPCGHVQETCDRSQHRQPSKMWQDLMRVPGWLWADGTCPHSARLPWGDEQSFRPGRGTGEPAPPGPSALRLPLPSIFPAVSFRVQSRAICPQSTFFRFLCNTVL